MNRIGIDVGGTKIEVLALRGDNTVVWQERVNSPREYLELLEAIVGLVRRADHALGSEGTSVGIGAPGSPNPQTGLHRNSNLLCMNSRPFSADLLSRLARKVHVTNDANCLALSESVDGAAAGYGDVIFGVILGTGIGGGLVVGGKVIDGRNGIAGEWGHNMLPGVSVQGSKEFPCYCGKFGCLEQFLSGPALERHYSKLSGAELSLTEISARSERGDDHFASETIERLVDGLARSLSVVVNVCDPHAIVLGGGVSNIAQLAERVQERLPDLVFSDACNTPVLRAKHGDSSGIRGAAFLATA